MPGTNQTRIVLLIQLISMFLSSCAGIWMMFDLLGLYFSPYSPNTMFFSEIPFLDLGGTRRKLQECFSRLAGRVQTLSAAAHPHGVHIKGVS